MFQPRVVVQLFSLVVTDNLVPEGFNISSILGEAELPEKCFSEPILEELVPRYSKVLLSGLKEEARVELVKKYLPPENLKAIVPPKMNPEVKVAIQDNTLKRDNRLSALQEQDLKETLQSTTISEWLFGTELENTIEVAKKLEKSGEQLKVRKNKPPGSTSASTPKQGNYRRPFAKGVQQMGHRFQRRTPPQSTNQKRTKSHRPYPTHRRNHSLERRRPY
nr:unnamed protein product [Callosobruchus analis]